MLRITQNTSAESACKYHDESLSQSDYYTEKSRIPGLWGGRMADQLGLSGEVSKNDFHNLCYNINPATSKQLTARNDINRTTGYDFTFDVPKSASIIYSQTSDPDIKNALDTAIQYTMAEIEQNAETRVRVNGRNENRITGNLIWAAFTHEDARPVGGVPDPHLHQHVFVFNATYDSEERKFKAGQFRNIKADATYYEAVFHNRLATELQKAGYALQRTAHNFEIAGFKRSTIDKFSNRTLEINAKAKELGLEYAEDKAKLGQKTRQNKRSGLDKQALKKEWTARLTPEEVKLIQTAKNKNRSGEETDTGNAAQKAIDHALEHGLERKSVIAHNELMTQALKHSMGSASREQLEAEIASRKDLLSKEINKKKVYTNTAAIEEEQKLIEAARSGKGQFKPINPSYVPRNKELNDEQQAAIKHALQSKDRIIIITGGAGTGKTTAVKGIVEGVRSAGINFHAFAPSSAASREVQQQEGFNKATTVADLLLNKNIQEQCKDGVIWIDEAGLIGCQTINKLMTLAQEQKARLLLTGDIRQHTAVERGDSLRILQKYAGIKPAYINKIQRQKNDSYKEAVKALSEGRIKTGYEKLDRMGAIKESGSFHEAVNALAKEYVTARKARESVLVVSATHRQGEALTLAIREGLKKEGKLAKKDTPFPIQTNLAFTEAQKKDKAVYEPGQAVQFHQNVNGGFIRGAIYDVLGANETGEILVEHNGQKKILPLQEAKKFSVYKTEQIGLAKGDIIRINQNGFSANKKRLNNGNTLLVKGFDEKGNILAVTTGKNEVILDKNHRNFTHAYYSTSPASQGKSVNRVLILQTTHTGKAASREQFYVSASRGKFSISIHTDNKERLLDSVQRTSTRMTAMEILSPAKEKNRIQAIREKLKDMGEAARSQVSGIKETFINKNHPARNTELQNPGISRSR